ncbi:MAG TPA: hypothetical protein VIK86_05600 [Candidatus Paceibacterota bacterium]
MPKGKVLSEAECADLKTTLAALYIANSSLRAYPIQELTGFKDSSKEETKGTSGSYGAEKYVKRAEYVWEFELINGVFYANRLRSFNSPNNAYDVIFLDEKNQMWGTTSVTAGVTGFKGYSLTEFHVMDNKMADGANAGLNNVVSFALKDAKEFNENIAMLSDATVNIELSDLKGMIDLTHTSVGGVLKISIGIQKADDKTDLYDTYATQFAALGNFIIKKGGVVKSVGTTANDLVAIAANPLTKKWDITLYAGSAGTDFTVEMQTPTVLAAAGIGGTPGNYFEDVSITTATVTAT